MILLSIWCSMDCTTVMPMNQSSPIHSSYCSASVHTKHPSDNHTLISVATPTAFLLLQVTSLNTRLISTTIKSTSGSESHQDIPSMTTEMTFCRLLHCCMKVKKLAEFAWTTETFHHNITHYLSFTVWRTIISKHPTMRPLYTLLSPPTDWNTDSPTLIRDTSTPSPTPSQYIAQFRDLVQFNPTSTDTTHVLAPRMWCASDKDVMTILAIYASPLIITIDSSFKPFTTQHVYPHPTTAHAEDSVTITTINNSHPTKPWMNLPTIPLLSRVQPRPTAFGTNNVTNNTAELLARVLVCELLPHETSAIIINDSAVVYSQHLILFGTSDINRQRTRTVFPAISWMLAQRLEATNVRANLPPTPINDKHFSFDRDALR